MTDFTPNPFSWTKPNRMISALRVMFLLETFISVIIGASAIGATPKPQKVQSNPLKVLPSPLTAASSNIDNKVADLKLYDLSKFYEMLDESPARRKPNSVKRYSTYEPAAPAAPSYFEKPKYGSYGKIHDTYQKKYEASGSPGKVSYEIKLYIPKYEGSGYPKAEVPSRHYAPSYENQGYDAPVYEDRPVAYSPVSYAPAPAYYEPKSSTYMKPYYTTDGKVMYEKETKPYYKEPAYESRSTYKAPVYEPSYKAPAYEPSYKAPTYEPSYYEQPKQRYVQYEVVNYEPPHQSYGAAPYEGKVVYQPEKKYMPSREYGYNEPAPNYAPQPVVQYYAPQERSYEMPGYYQAPAPAYPNFHTYQVY